MRGGSQDSERFDEFSAAFEHLLGAQRRARSRSSREVTGGELSFSQFQLIGTLADGELSVGELAEDAGVTGPTVTRMLDGLERMGIVSRKPSAEDRRVVVVSLTSEGRRLLERKQERYDRNVRALYNSFTEAERREIAPILDRLADAIEDL